MQRPKLERHGIEPPKDLGCLASYCASNIICGLVGVEGRRNIFGSLVHDRQFSVRHIRGRRRAHENCGTPGGRSRRCRCICTLTSIQHYYYRARKLGHRNVRVSIPEHYSRCRSEGVWCCRFLGWCTRLVRNVVDWTNREFILRILDFSVRDRRSFGLRWWSCICPTASPRALIGVRFLAPLRLTISRPSDLCLAAIQRIVITSVVGTNRRWEVGRSMPAPPGHFRRQLVPLLPRRHRLRCPDIWRCFLFCVPK
jgi:hypothetical protein